MKRSGGVHKSETSTSGRKMSAHNGKEKYDKKKVQCYCSKFCNFAVDCWSNKERKSEEANISKRDFDDEFVLLMVFEYDDVYLADWWYMDTGCSNYLTGNKKWLVDFDSEKKTKIICADDKYLNAKGMGNVVVVLNNGKSTLIQNVWYIPSMKSNMMSYLHLDGINIVSFVDEFTRMKWASFKKFKHEAFVEFKKFRIKVENQCGQKLNILKTGGGDTHRRKLGDKSKVMLLVGYHNTCAYKLYCLVTNKVEFSIDVIMKESEVWDLSKSQSNFGVVLTSKDTSESKGYEDKSESEDDFEAKYELKSEGDSEDEEVSKGESNSEGEYDSDPDSDDDLDYGGQHSEGGHAYKGGTYGVPTFDTIPASEGDSKHVQRP
ncbi:uncharacterized protein LOC127087006 [Lathyrus oleraceus]|uniref:uncharacterized protein LOC127087006 n=1 Tax=Pisum sativum TaxID=3888 RepID=UPI0021CF7119|nr:uncharacterized protein LOC127087006 [Pisum sativum]